MHQASSTPSIEGILLSCNLTCLISIIQVGEVEQYLERGPGFIFLFHPALGPLWDVIAQKLRGGCLEAGAELVLQVAEADVQNLQLDGSLLVNADAAMGLLEAPVRRGRPGGYPGRSGVQSLLHLLERGADRCDPPHIG